MDLTQPTTAQTGPVAAESPATQLDAISVTATRAPRTLNDTAATVSVIDSEEIERRNVQNPREAVRYEPGVSVGSQPARAGATNYVIRGIGDNRVRVQIDNIRVPDFPGTNMLEGSVSVYFAGDTDLFDGMSELAGRVDVALLPVAGWGPRVPAGHLDPERAAEAVARIRPRIAVPIHWGTLRAWGAQRGLDPVAPARSFAEAVGRLAPATEVHVLMPGKRLALSPLSARP